MELIERIDQVLAEALEAHRGASCPPGLDAAVHHAVFPGGARIRPQICLAVAEACGEDQPAATDAAAASIELLHCASLVHDDLPCFDDSPLRRGRSSVHQAYGERLAVLAGDALIVLAFQVLARGLVQAPDRLPALLGIVSNSCGMPERDCCRPGLGMRGRCRAGGISAVQDRFAVRGGDDGRRCVGRDGCRTVASAG